MGRKALEKEKQRISHHFKLKPDNRDWIVLRCTELKISHTRYIETLIEADRVKPKIKNTLTGLEIAV